MLSRPVVGPEVLGLVVALFYPCFLQHVHQGRATRFQWPAALTSVSRPCRDRLDEPQVVLRDDRPEFPPRPHQVRSPNSNQAYTGPRDRTVAGKSSWGFGVLFGTLSDRPASVSIVALQDITAGEEVYNNYGRKGNARLLATYG